MFWLKVENNISVFHRLVKGASSDSLNAKKLKKSRKKGLMLRRVMAI